MRTVVEIRAGLTPTWHRGSCWILAVSSIGKLNRIGEDYIITIRICTVVVVLFFTRLQGARTALAKRELHWYLPNRVRQIPTVPRIPYQTEWVLLQIWLCQQVYQDADPGGGEYWWVLECWALSVTRRGNTGLQIGWEGGLEWYHINCYLSIIVFFSALRQGRSPLAIIEKKNEMGLLTRLYRITVVTLVPVSAHFRPEGWWKKENNVICSSLSQDHCRRPWQFSLYNIKLFSSCHIK